MTLEDQAIVRKLIREEIEAVLRGNRLAPTNFLPDTEALRWVREPGFGDMSTPELSPTADVPWHPAGTAIPNT